MASSKQSDAAFRQSRLDLAYRDYLKECFPSVRTAAQAYDVPRSTLQSRVAGIQPKHNSIAQNRLITPTKESNLISWILAMDKRGMPPYIATVREMAHLLITQKNISTLQSIISQKWVRKFINRNDSIKSIFNQKYGYEHAKCEDPKLLRKWFRRVQKTIAEYNIHNDDIYNFDETSFQMEIISTSKVITSNNQASRARTIQPGNRE